MMSKSFMFKFMIGLFIVAAAVLWLLSVSMPKEFGGFSLSWAVVLLAGGTGSMIILYGLFKKDITTLKKFYIYFGAGLLIVALFALLNEVAIGEEKVLPIISVIVAVALLLGLLATGGKNWDQGDNRNVGYKNYFERKKEEEKQNEKDEK